MISVLLFGTQGAAGRSARVEDVVRGLASLVPAAVDGVVREVQLIAGGTERGTDDPALAQVAEHAGCAYVAGALADAFPMAVSAARSPFVLMLLPGISFDRALIDEMAAVATRQGDRIAAGIALKAVGGGLPGRLVPRLSPTVGLLTTRDRLADARPVAIDPLWRGLQARYAFTNRAWAAH